MAALFLKGFMGLIITNIVFLCISYGVNKDNARFLIAGYNTMSQEKRNQFDIVNYLIFFKNFFINLTVYSSLVFCGVLYLFDLKYAVIVYTLFLILSFAYFLIMSNRDRYKK